MPRPLKFLLLAAIWTSLIYVSFLFFVKTNTVEEIGQSISDSTSVIQKIKALFQNSDSWNYVLLTFIATLGILLFSLNDQIVWNYFKKRYKLKSDKFFQGGLLWSARMTINSLLLIIQIITVSYLINISVSNPYIVDSVNAIEDKDLTVLLLGTSKYLRGTDKENLYYSERIKKTVEAWKSGRVSQIIISGDRAGDHYDETRDMKNDLIGHGVRSNSIILDPNGYRTFDSIKRLRLKSNTTLVVVSQGFHLERALFLARNDGINAKGLMADGDMNSGMLKRELLAKTKVLLDIYIFNTQTPGVQAYPRRSISLSKTGDMIIILFVLGTVAVSGLLSRNLLKY